MTDFTKILEKAKELESHCLQTWSFVLGHPGMLNALIPHTEDLETETQEKVLKLAGSYKRAAAKSEVLPNRKNSKRDALIEALSMELKGWDSDLGLLESLDFLSPPCPQFAPLFGNKSLVKKEFTRSVKKNFFG